MPALEWGDLRVFLAVFRTGTHAGAARALRVAPTTIGRRLAALEDAVGARLFARTPDGLAPTAPARALLPRAERAEAEIQDAVRELTGADARATGSVRLTCADGFATFVLGPALPEFLAGHPGLTVELIPSIRVLDITRGEADVALRLFPPREKSLIARRIGIQRYGLYGSPAYVARRGTPRAVRDLAAHDLVVYDRDLDRLRSQAWFLRIASGAKVAVRTSSTTAIHAICAAGGGIALLARSYVHDDPRFVNVVPRVEPPASDMWLVMHADLRSSARVSAARRFIEGLVKRSEHPA